MYVIAISGAHRDSNTEKLLREVIRGCKKKVKDVKIELIKIRKHKISQCCGWSDCYYKNYCIVKDEMQEIYRKAEMADGWILASPTYFDNVSGYMKIFIDRMNPYCKPPRYKGKKVVLVAVGGASLRSIKKCMLAMKRFAKHMRLNVVGTIMAKADKKNEICLNKSALKEAYETGQTLAEKIGR
jgi:multimeric flavodoxin WrbA